MPEIVSKNPVNDPTGKKVNTHSTFRPNYSMYQGAVFGLNTPVYAAGTTDGDKFSVRIAQDIDTLSLKAPSMTPLRKNIDHFFVPLRAILPINAERLLTPPLFGDDVDASKVNSVVDFGSFYTSLEALITYFLSGGVGINGQSFANYFVSVFQRIQFLNLLLSENSLLKNLGYSLSDLVRFSRQDTSGRILKDVTWDELVESVFDYIRSVMATAEAGGTYPVITIQYYNWTMNSNGYSYSANHKTVSYSLNGSSQYGYRSFNELVYDICFGERLVNTITLSGISSTDFTLTQFYKYNFGTDNIAHVTTTVQHDVNLLRLCAYQIACAEFYTSDKVDDIYSGQLYIQSQKQWTMAQYSGANERCFGLNGCQYEYDVLSGYMITKMLNGVLSTLSSGATPSWSSSYWCSWCYVQSLFGYTRSLRYQDYFVGSRQYPMAIGDTDIQVNSGVVDVVDVTRSIQMQRFLNQVNRVGRKFNEYFKGIFNNAPSRDMHDPIFLGHVSDTVGASEVTNTGTAQVTVPQSKTSNYRSNSNRYMFEASFSEPGIVIGIMNFDIPHGL